jgi:hypothetical protein
VGAADLTDAEVAARWRGGRPWRKHEPRWSNCLRWAWRQFHRYGGVVWTEPSQHGSWCHAAWSPDGAQWFAYVPYWDKQEWIAAWHQRLLRFPPPWFRGRVVEGKR